MGEARRKREKCSAEPCVCGSGLPGIECCYNGRTWHKESAKLGLKNLPQEKTVPKCYMNSLGSCDGSISGEHLISKSIILLLKGETDFTVSGLPWIPSGTEISIAPGNLTANCLCRKHNSAIHPLDDAALNFFGAIKAALGRDGQSSQFLVSGHDIERWLLKTVKAMAASSNLSSDGKKLSGDFISDIDVLDLLDDPQNWPDGTGLYCTMIEGQTT